MKFLFVMDPLERVSVDKDTTFVFMLESQTRGHEVHFCEITDLVAGGDGVHVRHAPVTVRREQGRHADVGAWQRSAAEEFDCIFMRKDPPFDSDFFFATHVLSLVDESKTFVFNRGSGLREANEKMFILRFPELTAETIVTARAEEVFAFRDRIGGDAVVKPLDGCGGAGVFRLHGDDLNARGIVDMLTEEGRHQIMVQPYLPASRDGDMRLLYLDGEPLGAVLRVPRGDDLRSNIHVGGSTAAATVGPREREICARVAPDLEALGIYFAGLDVIGGMLSEVNVTSPTCVQEADHHSGQNLEAKVIDFVERKVGELDRPTT